MHRQSISNDFYFDSTDKKKGELNESDRAKERKKSKQKQMVMFPLVHLAEMVCEM